MSCLSWNCHGIENPQTVTALKRYIRLQNPAFVFIMETKLVKAELDSIFMQLEFSKMHVVECDTANGGRRGGMCLMWRDNFKFSLRSDSSHHIDGVVDDGEKIWRFVGVYGWPKEDMKYLTWKLLWDLADNQNSQWLCVGDFNEILFSFEKIGGRLRSDAKMEDFHNAIREANLDDLGYEGYSFTWTNGQTGADNIQERLDRCLGTLEWVQLYPEYHIKHLPCISSDHCPILINWYKRTRDRCTQGKGKKFSRFESMWLSDESCQTIVRDAWNGDGGSTGIQAIKDKISNCGQSLKD
ncbi:hypothetical protein DH2020_046433 [Rehmannia glutinosa]|uniref:Endonuclease/exonuclease/phosphatase domain-containing protein n=1 Tax=Rehmannia glutinosa TaxID=99300 RepID=A0ABR0UC09_REHGL